MLNASKYLHEAIESILNQTFADFEFILINDGSTDNTLEIIRGYERKDKRIIVIEKDNTGLADSLNKGIELAVGDWIARMDQDDVAMTDRILKQIHFVRDNADIVLLGTGCIVIDENGKFIKRKIYPIGNASLVARLENNGTAFPHSSVLFKLDEAKCLGGYRIRLNGAEDRDLWLRLSMKGQIACLEEPLIKLRKHQKSMSAGSYKSLVLSHAATLSYKLKKHHFQDPIDQDEDHYKEFRNWLEFRLKQKEFDKESELLYEIEKRRYEGRNIWKKISVLSALMNRHGFRLIGQRLFGSRLATKLTNEWIKIQKT